MRVTLMMRTRRRRSRLMKRMRTPPNTSMLPILMSVVLLPSADTRVTFIPSYLLVCTLTDEFVCSHRATGAGAPWSQHRHRCQTPSLTSGWWFTRRKPPLLSCCRTAVKEKRCLNLLYNVTARGLNLSYILSCVHHLVHRSPSTGIKRRKHSGRSRWRWQEQTPRQPSSAATCWSVTSR